MITTVSESLLKAVQTLRKNNALSIVVGDGDGEGSENPSSSRRCSVCVVQGMENCVHDEDVAFPTALMPVRMERENSFSVSQFYFGGVAY